MFSPKNEDKEKENTTNQTPGRLSPFCDLISEFKTFHFVHVVYISKTQFCLFYVKQCFDEVKKYWLQPISRTLSLCLASWLRWTLEDSVQWWAGPLKSGAPLLVFSFIAFVKIRLLKIKSFSSDIQFKKYITTKINSSQSNFKVFYKH